MFFSSRYLKKSFSETMISLTISSREYRRHEATSQTIPQGTGNALQWQGLSTHRQERLGTSVVV
jgi:hypothetical protein